MPLEVDFLLLAPTCLPFHSPWCCAAVSLAPLVGSWGSSLCLTASLSCLMLLFGVRSLPVCSFPPLGVKARGNPTGKGSTGLIKPWGYSQWLVQTESWAMAEML